ncbi:MAG: hypothetical protein U9O49_02405 [Candidatus Thermoplasmatota archaeon]|nr:hypothetical protein [Candidatus Thermoplasmatota archaeon]
MIKMESSGKRKKLFDKNILIALLVSMIVIAVAYTIITTPPDNPPPVFTPDIIMDNPKEYVGKTISVDGYYDVEESSIISKATEHAGTDYEYLSVNLTNIENGTMPEENVKYRFTGELTVQESDLGVSLYILIAEKIEKV